MNRQIRILTRTDEYKISVQVLRTVLGINLLTAMTLLVELFNSDYFQSLGKLAIYFGLVPDTDCSGETDLKNMTNRKNQFLLFLIMKNTWITVPQDPAL